MSSQPPHPPRPKSAEATKQAILAAARKRFLEESYESVGLRDISRDVGVDVALVSRYFGSKEGLFRDVVRGTRKKDILPPDLPAEEIAGYLAKLFLAEGDDANENVERLLIILRSASSPAASQVVSEALRNDVLIPFAQSIGGKSPEVRASTSMAVWMGMTIMRTVMAVKPVCERSPEIEARLRALFETALSETNR
ncbi:MULTISPECIES: TetR/AcrR family transcriptional regulator [Aurantiacibacter]|uniref:TetR/AcrR family transcriptional regulator n=1 Tax=Aurantiacibacter zhengii TaxID=2307003 RepID=A0A418NVJ8_9SPHN|nr:MULTISPECIES: TetR/AcrR family transcriptional regulator [Aurantiacibacter]MDP5263287.1 TetR family transcriptional regulator [Aurantiacibacter sp. 219JJ12-13]RIV88029.1 TetR/AcrR family transcriptional regulator [Aurantiacibacter zhengii]